MDDKTLDQEDLPQPQSMTNDDPEESDDSDSDSDSDGEAQQNLQLQALESELSTNPSNYDIHLEYIKLLRKMGEIEKLREAREAMNAIFPLSPTLWQEWAKDEASLSTGPEAVIEIEKLYERGVSEYHSVSLWCDYLNFVQENDPSISGCSPSGISKARNLFERAITAAGLHITEGSKIWETYRDFERAVLLTIDETDKEAKEKQVPRIRSIFHRQLSVPLADLDTTLQAYKDWELEQGNDIDAKSSNLDGIFSNINPAYNKALEVYNARRHLEEQISKQDLSEADKFQEFMTYLKFENSFGDPARVQLLYERAISVFPVSSDLWLDYTRHLDKTLKAGKVVRDVYSRATKSCPWVGELWVRYLLSLERGRASEEEISTIFGKSLQCSFSTLEEYLDVYLTRIDGLRRRILMAGAGEVLDYSLIRETFQQAADYLSPHMKYTNGLLHLHAYWARLELKLGKDLVAARGVWESLLKNSGSMLEAWQGYIAMEIELGNINEARTIYRRCYSKKFAGTGSEDICNAWLRFEKEYTTLEDLDRAVQKVMPRLEELRLFKLQQESNSVAVSTDKTDLPAKKTVREKRKSGPSIIDEQSPAKRPKNKGQKLKGVEEPSENVARGDDVKKIETEIGKPEGSNEVQKEDSSSIKPKVYMDNCTVFISNLNLAAKYDDVRKFFGDNGGIESIRILRDKFTGKSRGLAYIDFIDDKHLAAALSKNKGMLLGKKLSVARSNPKKKGSSSREIPGKHAEPSDTAAGKSVSKESNEPSKDPEAPQTKNSAAPDHGRVQLKGKPSVFVPRNVRPLGVREIKPKNEEVDETPKSNDEFRKMFVKK